MTERVAVVVNPVKVDLDEVRSIVDAATARHGLQPARWYETTPEDPGTGQARTAVEEGATLICPLGGDGTVRAVAEAVAGTDAALGLLPGGTGNLLARNLGLPVDDLAEAVEAALSGTTRRIDVGVLRCDDGPEQVFVVMAGMGLDAETMDGANESVKDAVGWPAYVASGLRAALRPGVRVGVDDGNGGRVERHARSVIVGNCGTLQGGVALMPEARLDDGRLDVIVVSPHGPLDWAALLARIALRRGHSDRLLHRAATERVRVEAERPRPTQIDGESLGEHRTLRCEVRPDALAVRVGDGG